MIIGMHCLKLFSYSYWDLKLSVISVKTVESLFDCNIKETADHLLRGIQVLQRGSLMTNNPLNHYVKLLPDKMLQTD